MRMGGRQFHLHEIAIRHRERVSTAGALPHSGFGPRPPQATFRDADFSEANVVMRRLTATWPELGWEADLRVLGGYAGKAAVRIASRSRWCCLPHQVTITAHAGVSSAVAQPLADAPSAAP